MVWLPSLNRFRTFCFWTNGVRAGLARPSRLGTQRGRVSNSSERALWVYQRASFGKTHRNSAQTVTFPALPQRQVFGLECKHGLGASRIR
jgi:hypothetical protein